MSKSLPARRCLPALAALLALIAVSAALPSIASACPPAGCGHHEPDDPTPHPPPGPPPPKYRVTIDTLWAQETEDSFEDQAYIRIKGVKVWGPYNTNPLQMDYPNVSREVTGPIWISVYDDDPDSWFDQDDWLGDAQAPLPASVGSTAWGNLQFTQDDAHYHMGVHVLRLS